MDEFVAGIGLSNEKSDDSERRPIEVGEQNISRALTRCSLARPGLEFAHGFAGAAFAGIFCFGGIDLLLVIDTEEQVIAEHMCAVNLVAKPREIALGTLR